MSEFAYTGGITEPDHSVDVGEWYPPGRNAKPVTIYMNACVNMNSYMSMNAYICEYD